MDRITYKENLEKDRIANGINRKIPIMFYDYNWIYLRLMRRYEYLDEKEGILNKIKKLLVKLRLRQYSVKTGISIPPHTFQGGLTLYHWGSVIVNESVRGGQYVTIQSATNISDGVILGDNVYIAPGAKILQNVKIADGVIIGANAVVTKDITEAYTSWAGVPAKKINNKGYIDRRKNE